MDFKWNLLTNTTRHDLTRRKSHLQIQIEYHIAVLLNKEIDITQMK